MHIIEILPKKIFHPLEQKYLAILAFLHIIGMQCLLFFVKNMKKLSQKDVVDLFSKHGCELLGKYEGTGKPVLYRCSCGRESNISLDKFRRRIKRKEGCIGCNSFHWDEEKDRILMENYGFKSRKEICLLIPGVSLGSIKARAKKLGLSGNKSASMSKAHDLMKKKYCVYNDFFAQKKITSSYWAGFIASRAKASIKKNTIYFSLPLEYKNILENFQDISCHTGVIKEKNKKLFLYFYGVKKWINDLITNYGLFSDNINLFELPYLSKEKNILSFIIGYIDGSGRVSKFLKDYKIEITGNKIFLDWIKFNFDKFIPPLGGDFASMSEGKRNKFIYSVRNIRAKYLIKKLLSIDVSKRNEIWNKFSFLK